MESNQPQFDIIGKQNTEVHGHNEEQNSILLHQKEIYDYIRENIDEPELIDIPSDGMILDTISAQKIKIRQMQEESLIYKGLKKQVCFDPIYLSFLSSTSEYRNSVIASKKGNTPLNQMPIRQKLDQAIEAQFLNISIPGLDVERVASETSVLITHDLPILENQLRNSISRKENMKIQFESYIQHHPQYHG